MESTCKKKYSRHVFWTVIIIIVIAGIIANGVIYYSNFQTIQKYESLTKKSQDEVKKIKAAIEAKKKEPVYISLPGAKQIRAIVEDYTKPDSIWVLINKDRSLPVNYTPSNLTIPSVATRTDKSAGEQSVRADIADKIKIMFDAALADGHNLMIGSGFRSADLQGTYFYGLANSVGESTANISIARPGQSEHQTGLAIDISTLSRSCYLDNCFATTADGEWLALNSYKFGFILRYPENKTSITGYQYESWHFRYVGVDLATALYESNLTLEEAWPYLETALATLKKNRAL